MSAKTLMIAAAAAVITTMGGAGIASAHNEKHEKHLTKGKSQIQ